MGVASCFEFPFKVVVRIANATYGSENAFHRPANLDVVASGTCVAHVVCRGALASFAIAVK